MFPLISSCEDLLEAKFALDETKKLLRLRGEDFDEDLKVGVMIEVPSAAMTVDLLIDEVDFLSIGTNDLIAYLMAADRADEKVARFYQPAHPAHLRLLKYIIEIAQAHKKTLLSCGEMASNPTYTLLLLGLGLRIFSVVPSAIPEIKKIIRSVNIQEAELLAQEVLSLKETERILEHLSSKTRKLVPDLF
jgi:phosphotransferase system enzyme I (PtsI)